MYSDRVAFYDTRPRNKVDLLEPGSPEISVLRHVSFAIFALRKRCPGYLQLRVKAHVKVIFLRSKHTFLFGNFEYYFFQF